MNTWPTGRRHAIDQSAHEAWNAAHFPGTRQICTACGSATGRCEEDALAIEDGQPLCEECYANIKPKQD